MIDNNQDNNQNYTDNRTNRDSRTNISYDNKQKKNKVWKYIGLIFLALILFSLFSSKDSAIDTTNNTNNKPNGTEQKPQAKTEYAIGETYEKDVFKLTITNPREEAASFGDKRYLIVDVEAVATKDVSLGISIDGLTDDGEVINNTIPLTDSNNKPFPLYEKLQAGQKIKGQVAFEITDGKKISKLRVKEAGKIINFNL